jgi:hypothetical protein
MISNSQNTIQSPITRSMPTKTLTATSTTNKQHRHSKYHQFFSNNHHHHHHRHHHQSFFNNHTNHYYSSKIDRSINNCEKFLPDHDLNNSIRENDLLLVHARQTPRFV